MVIPANQRPWSAFTVAIAAGMEGHFTYTLPCKLKQCKFLYVLMADFIHHQNTWDWQWRESSFLNVWVSLPRSIARKELQRSSNLKGICRFKQKLNKGYLSIFTNFESLWFYYILPRRTKHQIQILNCQQQQQKNILFVNLSLIHIFLHLTSHIQLTWAEFLST